MKKRLFAILLTVCMVLSMAPAALAAEAEPFTDVRSDDWYYNAVQYVYENGLMKGTSNTTFSPATAVDRAMIVTILYRLEGQPTVYTSGTFSDVKAGQYYAEAVEWAYANEIVGGYGNALYGPADSLTREQLAAILYRYAQYKGYDVRASVDLTGYSDVGTISAYAVDAFEWATANGLIKGTTATTLSPKGTATRAQLATILYRFCEKVAAEKHTVTFDYNYGSKGAYTTVMVADGETVKQPINPTRSGYSFSGWYTKAIGGSQFNFNTAITDDLTLYAHWSSNGGGYIHTHSYTYTDNGDGTHTAKCACGDEQTQDCTYDEYTHNDDNTDTHSRTCAYCGHVDTAPCTYESEAVYDGTKYTCPTCGYSFVVLDPTDDDETYVAAINGTGYTSLEDAIDKAVEGAVIVLLDNVTTDKQIDVDKAVTINGNGKTITSTNQTTGGTGFAGILVTAGATIQNLTVVGPNKTASGWDEGQYGIKVYNTTGVKLSGVTVTEANAGIQVNSSEVTLEGTITVTGNEFGGIEVCKSKNLDTAGTLNINGATVVCEDATLPAIWIDKYSQGEGSVTDADAFYTLVVNSDGKDQKYFFTSEAPTKDAAAKVGTENYLTVSAAIKNIGTDEKTVTLLNNLEADDLIIPENVTLDTNVFNVTGKIYQDENKTIELIYSADQLKAFAAAVNSGNTYSGMTVKLMADIDLENQAWTPIGNVSLYPGITFAGTFDGMENTISNLNAVDTTANHASAGLFGSITGKVRNLYLNDITVTSTHYAGGVVGYSSANVGMEISNCHVNGAVIVTSPEWVVDDENPDGGYNNGDKVGGIIGYCVAGDVVTGCSVTNATIIGYRDIGGIVGYAAGTVTGNSIGEKVTLIQDNTNGYKTEITTIGSIIGRDGGATASDNSGEAEIEHRGGNGTTTVYTAAQATNTLNNLSADTGKIEMEENIGTASITNHVTSDAEIVLNGNAIAPTNGVEVQNGADLTMTGGELVFENDKSFGYIDVRPGTSTDGVYTFESMTFTSEKLDRTYGPCTDRVENLIEFCPNVGGNATFYFKDCVFNNAAVLFEGLSGQEAGFTATFEHCTFNNLGTSAGIQVANYLNGTITVKNCTFNYTATASASAVSTYSSSTVTINFEGSNTVYGTAAVASGEDGTVEQIKIVNPSVKVVSVGSNTTVNGLDTVTVTGIATK